MNEAYKCDFCQEKICMTEGDSFVFEREFSQDHNGYYSPGITRGYHEKCKEEFMEAENRNEIII